jgi:subtilisin family serine protease
VTIMVIRRMLAAAWVAGLAAVLSGAAASPAWAAPGHRGGTGLTPLSSEWWTVTWKLSRIWPLTQGAGVTVAVLDTGVQASVPDLRGAVLPGGDVTGHRSGGVQDFNTDGDGHGTMMAALIAGQGYGTGMIGVAPKAQILPVTVNAEASDVTSEPSAMAAGIIYAANHGAQIIDVSQEHPSATASGCDPAEQAAVAYALARDIIVVAAAGDTNLTGTGPVEPASCAGVLAIGAVGPNRALWPGNARQPYLTVVNPGASLVASGRDGHLVTGVSGTRAASALAAGVLALIRARYPRMPWYQVVQRVTATALQEGGQVPNDSFGYGIFRLSHAVDVTAYPVPASAPNPVYAKYRAWLATPQGRSVSRQLARPAPPKTASRPSPAGPSPVILIAVLALVTGAVVGAALAVRLKHTPAPRRNTRRRAPSRAAFPDLATEPEDAQAGSELLDSTAPGGYLVLGEPTPYRIPPYTPGPVSAPLEWPRQ